MKNLAKAMLASTLAVLALTACSTHRKQGLSKRDYIPYGETVPISPQVVPRDYTKSAPILNSRTNDLSLKGIKFHSLLKGAARNHSVNEVFDFLDKLSFRDSCGNEEVRLHVATEDIHSLGDESYFYIGDKANRYDQLYQYMYAKPSAEAAWQVYLFCTSTNVMPLYWHGGYERRHFIFDEVAVNEIDAGRRDDKPLEHLDLRGLSKANLLLPEVKMSHSGRKADVYCTYWNDWQGLVRDHLQIEFLKDGKVKLTKCDPDVLVAYNCGICF